MKFTVSGLLTLSAVLLLVSAPLSAHHEVGAKFDDKKPVTLKGLVTKIDWANPHVHIFINVQNGNSVRNWAVELESPVDLGRAGWSRDTVKPGEALTVQGILARNGTQQAWANSVVTTNGGKKLFDIPPRPAPRADSLSVRVVSLSTTSEGAAQCDSSNERLPA